MNDSNCFDPACNDMSSLLSQARNSVISSQTNIESIETTSDENKKIQCPLDRSELGLSTWNYVCIL